MPLLQDPESLEKELVKAGRFGLGVLVFGGITYLLLEFFINPLQWSTAVLSSLFLNLLGVPAVAVSSSPPLIEGVMEFTLRIIPLCTGHLEFAVLLGGIASTEDRTPKERVGGIVGAAFFVTIVNVLRVSFTALSGRWFGILFMDVVHETLFRATIVVAIVGYYLAWYIGWQSLKRRVDLFKR
jgi:exosortase/archaeosortase family protein